MNFTFDLRVVRALQDELRTGLNDQYGFTRDEVEHLLDTATIRIARVGLESHDRPTIEVVVRHPRFRETHKLPYKKIERRLNLRTR
jgi:hypothetical protein